MKKFFLTIYICFCAVFVSSAQPTFPSNYRVKVGMPSILKSELLSDSDINKFKAMTDYGQSRKLEEYWTVFSDRANNTTYNEPSTSSGKYGTLKFGQKVRIAEIRGKMALVYEEPRAEDYPKISKSAKCLGWIEMSKLLLWGSCPTNDKGILNKALLCVNLNNSGAHNSEHVLKAYLSPDKKGGSFDIPTDMNFYFIMKWENNMALLATQHKMEGDYTHEVLYCWIEDFSFVPWNQRSCLEPTWKHEDVEFFAASGINAEVYANSGLSGKYISRIHYTKKESPKYQQYLYRMGGNSLRYPILDNTTATVYNMSTFSTFGSNAGQADIIDQEERIIKKQKEVLKEFSHINLVLAIDGTSSMEPYYAAVKEAIKQGLRSFKNNDVIKVGAVIYRDYSDGDGLVETIPLRPIRDIQHFNNFLDSGGTYGIKSSNKDKTQEEALYCGLSKALSLFGGDANKKESNILVVVGDCGNDANDQQYNDIKSIIDEVIRKEVSVLGFQVQNKNNSAYVSFTRQITEIIRISMGGCYSKLSSSIVVKPRKSEIGYAYDSNSKQKYFFGNHAIADPSVNNGQVDPSVLTENIISSLTEYKQIIDNRKASAANASATLKKRQIQGRGIQDGEIDIEEEFLESVLGKEYMEMMKKSGALVNFKGYVKKKDNSGRDFFKPVIFISQEEYDALLKRMLGVYQAAESSNPNDRTPYIEAMKALVKSLAPGMTDEEMSRLDNAQITKMIGGLNEAPEGLTTYTLDDMSNTTVVPADKFQSITHSFCLKYKRLKLIRDSKSYHYVKEFNGAKYFWIPIEELP